MTPAHISYRPGVLQILDQTQLPSATVFLELRSLPEAALAIKRLAVRGAPAIGITAAYAMAMEAHELAQRDIGNAEFFARLQQAGAGLVAVRPTAVNLAWAVERQLDAARSAIAAGGAGTQIARMLDQQAETLHREDIEACRHMGDNGASYLLANKKHTSGLRVLTHCNTGDLATGGYGTALGIIRSLRAAGKLERVLVDETRPVLQGARLTVWELQQEGIPHALITDSMAAHFMQREQVDGVVVGADRIARNGDVANKIGTYALALAARAHGLPFVVAAPLSTFDPAIASGADILIEERNPDEVTSFAGVRTAPAAATALNPAFDVTPAALISAIVTEAGVLEPPLEAAIARVHEKAKAASAKVNA